MSNISLNINKSLKELLSKLLSTILDPRLKVLEIKTKEEMNKIQSVNQTSKSMETCINDLNKKVGEKISKPKSNSIHIYKPLNLPRRNYIDNKITTRLKSSMVSRNKDRTPERNCYYSKGKISNYRCRLKSDFSLNELFLCKKNSNSTTLNLTKRNSKQLNTEKNSPIRKKNREQTIRSTTPNIIHKFKKREKTIHFAKNTKLTKNNSTNNFFLYKRFNKSCKYLPKIQIQKQKNNKELKLSKTDELDLICAKTKHDEKRINELNPDISKSLIINKKITSSILRKKTDDFYYKKKEVEVALDESTMKDVDNDELLVYYHDKKSTKLIEDITLPESDEDEIKIEFPNNNFPKINNTTINSNIFNSNNHIKNNITNINTINVKDEINTNENNKNICYNLEERIEISLEHIVKYLNNEDILKMGLINKECFKIIMNYLISKKGDYIDEIKESFSQLKNNNSDKIIIQEDFNTIDNIKPLEFNDHTIRTLNLLNNVNIEQFFKIDESDDSINKNILLIFDIFFISLGYKKKIFSFKNNVKSKWNFYKNYFIKTGEKNVGPIIEKKIKGRIFDFDIINSLYEYSHDHLKFISPNYFQNSFKSNSNINLFVFIVKNILEHVGINKDNKNVSKLYLLYNARININTLILQKLNKINSIISKK